MNEEIKNIKPIANEVIQLIEKSIIRKANCIRSAYTIELNIYKSIHKYVFIGALFVLFFSISKLYSKGLVVIDQYKPLYSSSYLTEKLEHCFIENDTNSLNQFFVEWNKTVLPNADTFINQNDTIATVYNIYKAFYNPFDIKNLGDGLWGYKMNLQCKYLIIQNKLKFLVADTDTFEFFDSYQKPDYEKKDLTTICNFRPPIKFDNYKNLYFTSEYDSSLNDLNNQFEKIDQNDKKKRKSQFQEIIRRYSILDQIFPIDWNLFSIKRELETPPYIHSIYLSRDLTKAKIYFNISNCCGEALMTKNDNDWKITHSILTIVW